MSQPSQAPASALKHAGWGARQPEPCTLVIFGASGDLTHRKLLPTLAHLEQHHPLPKASAIVGLARRPSDDEQFRKDALASVEQFANEEPLNEQAKQAFASRLYYHRADFTDLAGYQALAKRLEEIDKERGGKGNRVFYLATPPSDYTKIIALLGQAGLNREERDGARGWSRVIIEKPFGRDLASAQALNEEIGQIFREDQIYRIDHYLGKETVQNLMAFRFGNGIFEPLWNQKYIDHVQILVAEELGVGSRAGYYEEAGTIRDMVQNHMMQLLSLTAMEPPVAFDANDVRDEKVKLLRSIRPLNSQEVAARTVRAQYRAGRVGDQEVPGYRQEQGVSPDSTTDTYVAVKLFIENWRWAGVPFYLRTGKRLPKRSTEVTIHFKQAPYLLFAGEGEERSPNVLTVRVQPDEGIALQIGAKIPGPEMMLGPVNMDFAYSTMFGAGTPEAYERLLVDCMLGDSTLFIRRDEVEAAWTLVDSIITGWNSSGRRSLPTYEAGTWGPREGDDLIQRDGRQWWNP
jgi:glucose-6-phosphate 1-dehydrogenase